MFANLLYYVLCLSVRLSCVSCPTVCPHKCWPEWRRSSYPLLTFAESMVRIMPTLHLRNDYPSSGTNFEILPELTWGVEEGHLGQPPGIPIGYIYFW